MSVREQLRNAWSELTQARKSVDSLELEVRQRVLSPQPKGRQLPFFESSKIVFEHGETQPITATLVQAANRETRIARINYEVYVDMPADSSGLVENIPLRPTRFGMWNRTSDTPTNATTAFWFDFEWTFALGSTERIYTNGRPTAEGLWNSRQGLGNQERDSQLLFSEKHPLIVNTGEFLSFSVKPFLYNPVLSLSSYTSTTPRYVVAFTCVGTRTFTYDT